MYCNQCRLEIPDNYKFCPKCGAEVSLANKTGENKKQDDKKIKKWVYLWPILFGMFGGLFLYFVYRNKNRKVAMKGFLVGAATSIIMIVFFVLIGKS